MENRRGAPPKGRDKTDPQSEIRNPQFLLRCGCRGRSHLQLLPVVVDVLLHRFMTKAGVEIILLHFRISLVVVPLVMGEPIDGAHYTRPVPAAGAMHEKLSCSCVINQL